MRQADTTLRPLDALWEAGTIIRIILAGEALALMLALGPGPAENFLSRFGMASFAIQWIALLAMAILFLARGRLVHASPVRVAQVALVSLVVSTWLVSAMAWLFLHDIWPRPERGWSRLVVSWTVLTLTVGLLALAAFQAHWRARQLAVRAKQAELEALQARIRPHFLFNTLNTGIALLHGRPEDAERVLLDLADLFRAALRGAAEVTLEEELSLTRRYLEIEALRLGPRLTLDWQVETTPADLVATLLPLLSVQPLVENAIRHGIEACNGGGTLSINVSAADDVTTVTIRNPRPAVSGTHPGHGIGLAAVQARVDAMPGGQGTLETQAGPGEFVARLRIRSPKTA